MRFWKKPEPNIPPPPLVTDTSAEAERMRELLEARDRRGKRLTRETKTAMAQNHFVVNFKKAMES